MRGLLSLRLRQQRPVLDQDASQQFHNSGSVRAKYQHFTGRDASYQDVEDIRQVRDDQDVGSRWRWLPDFGAQPARLRGELAKLGHDAGLGKSRKPHRFARSVGRAREYLINPNA
jgi:hypothetical protein